MMTTEELQRLVDLYDAGQAYDGPKETLERQRAKLARELIAARRVVEEARPYVAFDASEMINLRNAISAYEEAKG